MKIRCGHCGKKYDIPERHLGKKFTCVKCDNRIKTYLPSQGDDPTERVHPVSPISETPPVDLNAATGSHFSGPDLSAMRPAGNRLAQGGPWYRNLMRIGLPVAAVTVAIAGGLLILKYQNGEPENPATDDPGATLAGNTVVAADDHSEARTAGSVAARSNDAGRVTLADDRPANFGQSGRFRDDIKYAGLRPPHILNDPLVDPTFVNYDITGFERFYFKELLLEYGLTYGGIEFQKLYERAMNSRSSSVRMDGAIACANWRHNLETAIPTILSTMGAHDVTADGKEYRLHYAARILNEYPNLVESAVEDIIANGDEGFDVCLDKLIEKNRITPDVFRATILAANSSDQRTVNGISLTHILDSFLGYSSLDTGFLDGRLNLNPFEVDLPRPVLDRIRRISWKDNGGKASIAGQTGLDMIPEFFDSLSFLRVSDVLQCGAMNFKMGPDSLKIAAYDQLEPLSRITDALNSSLAEVQFVTTGQPSDMDTATEATTPTLMIVRFKSAPDQDGLSKIGERSDDGQYLLEGGYFAAFVDNLTLAIGTSNEVDWCRNRRSADHIHPAVFHWQELEYCDAFQGDNSNATFFQFDMRTADASVLTMKEYFVDLESSLSPDEWREHNQQLADILAEFRRGQQGRDTGMRAALERWSDQNPGDYPSQAEIDRIRPIELSQEMRGTRLAREARGHHVLIMSGPGFAMTDPFEFQHDMLTPDESPIDLPADDDEIREFILALADETSVDTIEYQDVLSQFLDSVNDRIAASPEVVTDVQALPTLEATFGVSRLFSRPHVEKIVQIANSVEFSDGQVDRSRWAIACLAPIHSPEAIHAIAGFLNHDRGDNVLNADGMLDGVEAHEFDSARSDNSRRHLVGIEVEQTELHLRVEFADRINQVCDRLGPAIDYYLVHGDERLQSDCVEIVSKVPGLKRGLNYRLSMLRYNPATPSDVLDSLNRFMPVQPIEFEVPAHPGNDTRSTVYSNPFFASIERAVDGDPAEVTGLELFECESCPFKVKLLATANAEDSVLDFYGSLFHRPKREDESVQEWGERLANTEYKPEDYRVLEGLDQIIEGSDAIQVDTIVPDIEELIAHWNTSNDMLGSNLVKDEAGDSGADFDRIRYFFIDGVPKAQRTIAWRDQHEDHFHNKVTLRWIGRNRTTHPAYVEEIVNSLWIGDDFDYRQR
ncbi:MAG: hypothetical protein AAF456_11645 [Planctomycetota bacterium]